MVYINIQFIQYRTNFAETWVAVGSLFAVIDLGDQLSRPKIINYC